MDIPGLEPPLWSRNWGDLDDELDLLEQDGAEITQTITAKPIVTFAPSVRKSLKDGKYQAKVLIVGVHDAACTFISSVWGSTGLSALGSILLPESPLDNVGLSSPADALKYGFPVTHIQSLPHDPSVVLVGCGQPVPPHRAFAWTTALFASIQADRVIVLDTLLESSFVTLDGSRPPPPVLRRLSTSVVQKAESERKESPASSVFALEAPNLVHGLSAAILSHCEIRSIPAELFVSIESPHSIGDTLAAFEAAFSSVQTILPQSFKSQSSSQKLSQFLSAWRVVDQARKLAGGRVRPVGGAQAAINAALGDLASSHGSSLERGRNAAPIDLFI